MFLFQGIFPNFFLVIN